MATLIHGTIAMPWARNEFGVALSAAFGWKLRLELDRHSPSGHPGGFWNRNWQKPELERGLGPWDVDRSEDGSRQRTSYEVTICYWQKNDPGMILVSSQSPGLGALCLVAALSSLWMPSFVQARQHNSASRSPGAWDLSMYGSIDDHCFKLFLKLSIFDLYYFIFISGKWWIPLKQHQNYPGLMQSWPMSWVSSR